MTALASSTGAPNAQVIDLESAEAFLRRLEAPPLRAIGKTLEDVIAAAAAQRSRISGTAAARWNGPWLN